MPLRESKNITRARNILRGLEAPHTEIRALAEHLKKEQEFGYARRILARARARRIPDPGLRRKLRQQHALCTYKDRDLPADARLDLALDILQSEEDLKTTDDQETLGLVGAIHKRRWEMDGQKAHLESAFTYYERGYKLGPANDQGYTGINAAFVLDLLADIEAREAGEAGSESVTADLRRQNARKIREDLITTLPTLLDDRTRAWLENEDWFPATIAEAFFGLGRYEEAGEWLRKAAALQDPAGWEFQATARQLAALARLRNPGLDAKALEESAAGQVLHDYLDHLGANTAAVLSSFVGKVGLALSGGGFRASLYHIGVLARLAEEDVLRHVEVLSCVSGGSIIGAHYYLEVRRLLQDKGDEDVTAADYVEIVERIARDFVAGVQENIRMQVAAEPATNVRVLLSADYTRTERMAELYEERIYSRVCDGEGDRPRYLNELKVHPIGDPDTFAPKRDNWRRRNKVPVLIVNATTLNTGHNWQFTASWMGESPTSIDPEVDGNYCLRRMYYQEAPAAYRQFRLGRAVAASACVPGLFEPIVLDGLYPDRRVHLVDGGVHDNQGIVGLLEQDCTVLLVSDASGQTQADDRPRDGLLDPPLRANNILMARVREAQHRALVERRKSRLLQGVMFVHLRKGLDVEAIDWIGCDDPFEGPPPATSGDLTPYGIRKEVQRQLATIRTDLDAFNDTEAYALMTCAYRMTAHERPRSVCGLPDANRWPGEWRFLAIEERLVQSRDADRVMALLDVSRHRGFKVWKLSRPLQVSTAVAAASAVVATGAAAWRWRSKPVVTVGGLAVSALTSAAAPALSRALGQRKSPTKIGLDAVMGSVGWIAARFQLDVLDKEYLRQGRIAPNEPGSDTEENPS